MALLVPSAHRGICSQRLVNFSSKPFPIPCLCQKKDKKGLGKLVFQEISLVKIQEYVSPPPLLHPLPFAILRPYMKNVFEMPTTQGSSFIVSAVLANTLSMLNNQNDIFCKLTLSHDFRGKRAIFLPVSRPPLVSKLRKT